jgi:hypothetical protein
MKQIADLAWDITDWDNDADLSESNLRYNMAHTFVDNGLVLPASIICRRDQEKTLLANFTSPYGPPFVGINTINTEYGEMKLKVLGLEREEMTVQPPRYKKMPR